MARAQWRRGFFRLWLVVSALWVAIPITLAISGAIPVDRHRTFIQLAESLEAEAERLEAEAERLEAEAHRLIIHTVPITNLDDVGSVTDLTDRRLSYALEAAVARARAARERAAAARARDQAAISAREFSVMATVTLMPPLFLLICGLLIAWVARGFRAQA